MEFDKRLKHAIHRGQHARAQSGREAAEHAATADELRNIHSGLRIELSEQVEHCLRKLSEHFPGFQFQTVVGEEGWGARITRDDLNVRRNRRDANAYSRMEMLIRPFSDAHIVELTAKGTIRNKETIRRSHYQFLSEADIDSFKEMIDLWVLEYAEQYAATE